MALWQGRSKRKPTGGRYRPFRKKRRREIGREQQYAFIGAQRLKLYRTKGGNRKGRILSAQLRSVPAHRTPFSPKGKVSPAKPTPSQAALHAQNDTRRTATNEAKHEPARG